MQSIVAVLIIIAAVFASFSRNMSWKNDPLLWTQAVTGSPFKIRALNNAGIAYYEYGDAQKAIFYYTRALKIYRYDVDVLYNKCMAHYVNGECSQAIDYCSYALLFDKNAEDIRYTLRVISERSCAKKNSPGVIASIGNYPGKEGHEKLLKAFRSKKL